MELKITWFFLATAFIAMVKAEPTDQGPQMFQEAKATTTTTTTVKPPSQKQHKRQPQHEKMRWKEVIMYLTPSQIRALESGQGRIETRPIAQPELPSAELSTAELPLEVLPKAEIHKSELPLEDPYKQLQNSLHEEGQTLQREYENFEADRKHRMQLTEAVQLQPANEPSQVPQTQTERPYIPEQNTEKYSQLFPQLQQVPRPPPGFQEAAPPLQKQHFRPENYAYLYFYPKGKPQNNHKLQLFYPELDESKPQQLVYQQEKNHELHLNPYLQQKFQFVPYEYGLPKRLEAQQLQAHVTAQQLQAHRHDAEKIEANRSEQRELQAQHMEAHQLRAQLENKQLAHTLEAQEQNEHQLQAQLEEQQLQAFQGHKLQAQLENQQQQAHELEAQQQEAHNIHAQLEQQQLQLYQGHQLQAQLENQQQQAHELEAQQLEAHNLQAQLEQQQLQAQQESHQLHAHLETKQLQTHKEAHLHALLEKQKLQAHKLEAQQLEAHALHERLEGQLLEVQELQAQQLDAHKLDHHFQNALHHLVAQQHEEDQLKAFNIEANQKEIEKLEAEKLEAEKQKERIEAHQREAQKLDEHLEALQLKAEKDKAEAEAEQQQPFQFIGDFEPNRGQMYSLFSPLLQRYNLDDTLKHHKTSLTKPKFEAGFVPSQQYAPKFNDEKYMKEVEKILRNIHFEKQNSLARATAISKEPPVVVKEEVKITKRPIHIIKHVNIPVPTPFFVPVPEPFEVKVPQPYAVPLEIIRPFPFPILKTEKLEVEKPVPFEVEKRVPYPVTKNVFVNVDKPFYVQKIVPVEIKKEIPIEIPIHKPQKLSIIRHVWEH